MTNSCCCDNLPVCILHLGDSGLEKYRLAKKWEQFKIVLLFMDHPVCMVFGIISRTKARSVTNEIPKCRSPERALLRHSIIGVRLLTSARGAKLPKISSVNTWFPVHLLANYSLINCEDAVKYKREHAFNKINALVQYSFVAERSKFTVCGRDEVEASNCEFWSASTQSDLVCSCGNENIKFNLAPR